MGRKGRIVLLVVIMTSIVAGVGGITIFIPHEASFKLQREWLVAAAQSRLRLVGAIAEHEKRYGRMIAHSDEHADARTVILRPLMETEAKLTGFDTTGEFSLVKREGDHIIFLLQHRHHNPKNPPPIPCSSRVAEPVRRALSGKSGTSIGGDCQGEMMLATHEHTTEPGSDVVAKTDIDKVKASFVRAGLSAGESAVALIFIGTLLCLRKGNPIVRLFRGRGRRGTTLLDNLPGTAYRRRNDPDWTMEFVSEGCRELTGYSPDALIGNRELSFAEIIHPDDRDKAWDTVQKALQHRTPFDLSYRIRTASGEHKWVYERGRGAFSRDGTLIGLDGFLLDVSEHMKAEESYQVKAKELQNHIKELDCLFGITDLAEKSGRSLDSIMEKAVDIAAASLQYSDIACARITLEDKAFSTATFQETEWGLQKDISVKGKRIGSLEIYYLEERPESHEGPFLRTERQLVNAVSQQLGRIIERIRAEEALEERHEQVIAMFDSMDEVVYVADPETYELLYMNDSAREQWGNRVGQKCYYVLQNYTSPCPFCTNERIFGEHLGSPYIWDFQNRSNLRWYHCIDRAISWPDGRMVRFEIAIDITDRKRAEEQIRILSAKVLEAHEVERKLVAQEIHDSIGASLAAAKYSLERSMIRNGTREVLHEESLDQAIATVQHAIEESRRISTNLRPSMIDDLGILPTISWFCRAFQDIYSNIRIEKEVNIEENDIPEDLKIVIFRILQEALNNVAKHSNASRAAVSLSRSGGGIELSIEDNGRGFDLDQVQYNKGRSMGLGLLSMQERTELAGGAFHIHSARGSGTTIAASWPKREGGINP